MCGQGLGSPQERNDLSLPKVLETVSNVRPCPLIYIFLELEVNL